MEAAGESDNLENTVEGLLEEKETEPVMVEGKEQGEDVLSPREERRLRPLDIDEEEEALWAEDNSRGD